jgi:hypothetical protein
MRTREGIELLKEGAVLITQNLASDNVVSLAQHRVARKRLSIVLSWKWSGSSQIDLSAT